jgi:hypothetical protein
VTLDGRDINLAQLNAGTAWFYRHYAKELKPEDAVAYEKAENAAKASNLGLWAEASPIPLWDFRNGKTAKGPGVKPLAATVTGPIVGNRNSKIYHLPNCPDFSKARFTICRTVRTSQRFQRRTVSRGVVERYRLCLYRRSGRTAQDVQRQVSA